MTSSRYALDGDWHASASKSRRTVPRTVKKTPQGWLWWASEIGRPRSDATEVVEELDWSEEKIFYIKVRGNKRGYDCTHVDLPPPLLLPLCQLPYDPGLFVLLPNPVQPTAWAAVPVTVVAAAAAPSPGRETLGDFPQI